jgi:hypothetical protein
MLSIIIILYYILGHFADNLSQNNSGLGFVRCYHILHTHTRTHTLDHKQTVVARQQSAGIQFHSQQKHRIINSETQNDSFCVTFGTSKQR